MILAGDIGGTNTRLALFEEGRELKMIAEKKIPSRNYPGLLPIVIEFLEEQKKTVSSACFGVAGPVREGKCRVTNLPWSIDADELKDELKMHSVALLNDLEANAWGLRVLKPEDFCLLQAGNSKQKGNAALISAGTGLGEAGLYWDGKEHHPFACEGSHSDFAPRNAIEFELHTHLKKIYGHVSFERVVSGPGLHHLYQFLVETGREASNEELKTQMAKRDPAAVISEWGLENRDRGCVHAVDWFISLYGAEAGNLALKFLSLGGFYIGGGIAPHLLKKFKQGGFLKAFLDKGRFAALLESIPVHIVLNDEAALLGAAEYARRQK